MTNLSVLKTSEKPSLYTNRHSARWTGINRIFKKTNMVAVFTCTRNGTRVIVKRTSTRFIRLLVAALQVHVLYTIKCHLSTHLGSCCCCSSLPPRSPPSSPIHRTWGRGWCRYGSGIAPHPHRSHCSCPSCSMHPSRHQLKSRRRASVSHHSFQLFSILNQCEHKH